MPPAITCDCGTCRKCKHRVYMREWYRAQPPERRQAIGRRTRENDPEGVRERDRKRHAAKMASDQEYRYKRLARSMLNAAVDSGRVVKTPCELCGNPEVEGHHDDYSKALEVRWLCTLCHGLEHRLDAKAA